MARPMPRDPPVTSARRPSSLPPLLIQPLLRVSEGPRDARLRATAAYLRTPPRPAASPPRRCAPGYARDPVLPKSPDGRRKPHVRDPGGPPVVATLPAPHGEPLDRALAPARASDRDPAGDGRRGGRPRRLCTRRLRSPVRGIPGCGRGAGARGAAARTDLRLPAGRRGDRRCLRGAGRVHDLDLVSPIWSDPSWPSAGCWRR